MWMNRPRPLARNVGRKWRVDGELPILVRHRDRETVLVDPGVAHDHVDGVEVGEDSFADLIDPFRIAHVERVGARHASRVDRARLLDDQTGLLLCLDVGEGHVVSGADRR